MDEKQQQHITRKYLKKVKKQVSKTKRLFDSEAIHELRLSYKKLRGFLRMISVANAAADAIKLPVELKKIYRVAGSLRDLQLQQQRILDMTKDEMKKPWDYIHRLQDEIKKSKRKFSRISQEDAIGKMFKKKALSWLHFLPGILKFTVRQSSLTSMLFSTKKFLTIRTFMPFESC